MAKLLSGFLLETKKKVSTQSLVPLTAWVQEKMKVLVVLGTTSGLGCRISWHLCCWWWCWQWWSWWHGLVPDGFGLDKSAGMLIKIAGVL
jgi:hypothetical protein